MLEKVTAFVTRRGSAGTELLLFRHPNAGIQLPAGTVENGELAADAALREVIEETGLRDVAIRCRIGCVDETLPGRVFVAHATEVYSRPNIGSFDWAHFRRGIAVVPLRTAGAFTQVTYEEWDSFPGGDYITYRITGWVPSDTLSAAQRRHFYHLTTIGDGPASWSQAADGHVFEPFWAPLAALPLLIAPQQQWLDGVLDDLHSALA